MHMADTDKFNVQRHDTSVVRHSCSFVHPNRPTRRRRGSRFRKDCAQDRPGPKSRTRKTMALLCDTVNQVTNNGNMYCHEANAHRTNVADGLPPTAESLLDCDERDRINMIPYLPADLQFLHKTYIIVLRAVVALSKIPNLQSTNCDTRVLRSLISIFDRAMLSLSQSSPSDIGMYEILTPLTHILIIQIPCNLIARVFIFLPFISLHTQQTRDRTKKH